MLQIGDMAPDFELISDAGKAVKLADFRGERVILFFYPKAATPGCTIQACGFRDRFPVITSANATVVGVSPDMPEQLAKWKAEESFPYALLSDPEHLVAEAYEVWGEKKMYGKTYIGIIRSHFMIGADGRLEDVQVNVSPNDSIERAIAHLSQA